MFRTPSRRIRRRRNLGMTLLEIMIVLAILALVMGLLVGPQLFKSFSESRASVAHSMVRKLAFLLSSTSPGVTVNVRSGSAFRRAPTGVAYHHPPASQIVCCDGEMNTVSGETSSCVSFAHSR